MTETKYTFQGYEKDKMSRATGKDVGVSTKQAIEICNYLRNRNVLQAKNLLKAAIEMKQPIPFKRFTDGLGHKSGRLAAGRYPVKAATTMLKLIESAEVNAQQKGLNTSQLSIIHICAHKARSPMRYGRQSRREAKASHIEVVVREVAEKKKEVKPVETKKEEVKPTEVKPTEVKKEEVKPVETEEEKIEAPKEEQEPKEEKK